MNALRRSLVLSFLVAILVSSAAPPARAVESCSAKVSRKTGVITVAAKGVTGTLEWSSSPGGSLSPFFNAGECVSGDKAAKCEIADPTTIAAKTPPGECTLYVHDSAGECAAWIPGCSPGLRGSEGLRDYVNTNCSLYFGWVDGCDGCTSPPAKWGKTNDSQCSAVGVDDTCTIANLGGDDVRLFGLNPDGDVDGTDKFYIGLRCF